MKKYLPNDLEPKWQAKWKKESLYHTDLNEAKEKYYVLAELSYPSGDLHIGHWFTYTYADVLARQKRMKGLNVLLPNGFDAFGLPAENAAIKRGIHPQDWTMANITRMKEQFDQMGASFDWEKTAITCLPEYYKWNQWIFLKMLEKGLAYRGKSLANWCPNCQTVLANENVEAGKCWRCGTEVIQKEIEQWFLKITAYADELLWPFDFAQGEPKWNWPKALQDSQNSWIGKSEGALIKFDNLEVFTTRPDTIFGATFLVISPENKVLSDIVTSDRSHEVKEYIEAAKKKSELERKESKEKTGVFTGSYVINPLNQEKIPVWVADYVLTGYGTGAIMGVPAHDERDLEFAKKYDLEVREVINQDGVLVRSGEFDGLSSDCAKISIIKYLELHQLGHKQVQYHLRDWSISRQRYWGTPIPIIYCDKCGVVPVPEEDLPVELPYKVDYTPKGKPPLATNEDWVNVKCPKCDGNGKREVETMDTFVDSSWYFFRYLDPKNKAAIFDTKIIDNWMPVDVYFGGPEHTLGHALYSRFFTKFFKDLGLIAFDEYAHARIHHGIILGPDGARMSKSKGNVVNPDEQVKNYGADAVRLYLTFLGPIEVVVPWNVNGLQGTYHFLERIWNLFDKVDDQKLNSQELFMMHKTIKKVSQDMDNIKFNTSIAAMMEWLNYLSAKGNPSTSLGTRVTRGEYKTLLLLLAPFAPHITEELWSIMGEKYSIHQQSFPSFDKKYLEEEEVTIVVQVNGKVRDQLMIEKDIVSNNKEIEDRAKNSPRVQKYLEGKVIKRVVYIPVKIINIVTD